MGRRNTQLFKKMDVRVNHHHTKSALDSFVCESEKAVETGINSSSRRGKALMRADQYFTV